MNDLVGDVAVERWWLICVCLCVCWGGKGGVRAWIVSGIRRRLVGRGGEHDRVRYSVLSSWLGTNVTGYGVQVH